MNAAANRPRFAIQSTQPPGGSVLDELTGTPPAAAPPTAAPAANQAARRAPAGPRRTPIRVHIPEALADRVRGAVATLAYQVPEWASLNAATAAALEQFVTAAEREHNDGEPFPWRAGHHLQPGRRVGQ